MIHRTYNIIKAGFALIILLLSFNSNAQNDTTKSTSVTIISNYKPALISVAKINFSAAAYPSDTNKIIKPYFIPAQNLGISYKPGTLKPLSIKRDLNEIKKENFNYLKVGYGLLKTPFLDAGVSYNKLPNVYVNSFIDYISSVGKIQNQKYSELNWKGMGNFQLNKNELSTSIAYHRNQYYLYGYNHDSISFDKKEISNLYQNINFNTSFKNTSANKLNIQYQPSLFLNLFSANDSLKETNLNISLPAKLPIYKSLFFELEGRADFSFIKNEYLLKIDSSNYQNNIYNLKSALQFDAKYINVVAGVKTFYQNNKLSIIPLLNLELPIAKKSIIIEAGINGEIIKNNYSNLVGTNPYLNLNQKLLNTISRSYGGGFRTNISKNISCRINASLLQSDHYLFFINDTSSVRSMNRFNLSSDEKINNFRISGELQYTLTNKLTINSKMILNGYEGMKNNARAWNTLPFESISSLTWNPLKKLTITSELYIFAVGHYLDYKNVDKSLSGGTDFNVGGSFKFNPHWRAFINVNNIFSQKYERWHNYPVYGLNGIGGFKVNF